MNGTILMIAAIVGAFLSLAEGRQDAGAWQQPSVLGVRLP